MTEEQWQAGTDPGAMLELMRRRSSTRKLRLFCCAHLRASRSRVASYPLAAALDRQIIKRIEAFVEGLADSQALSRMIEQRLQAKRDLVGRQDFEGAAHNRDRTDLLLWCLRPDLYGRGSLHGTCFLPLAVLQGKNRPRQH